MQLGCRHAIPVTHKCIHVDTEFYGSNMFVEEKDCIKGQGLHVYKHQYKKFVVFLGLLLPWGKFYGFQINTSQTQPAFKMVLRIESADKSQSGEKSTYQILVRGTLLPQFALS